MHTIVSTGSQGNATILNGNILIDCGVSARKLKPYIKDIRLVLLTHSHSDHFKATTLSKIMEISPLARVAYAKHMEPLVQAANVPPERADMLKVNTVYDFGVAKTEAIPLPHNVPNVGWKIQLPNGKRIIYATDTSSLDHVEAENYDLYMIEANYEIDEIAERIRRKEEAGTFAYEHAVLENHMSKEKADAWLIKNIGNHSEYVYMHEHHDRHGQDPVL